MKYSENLKKFFAEDTTQAFGTIFLFFTILLLAGQIDMQVYESLMKWGIAGFFGEKLTNFKGLR